MNKSGKTNANNASIKHSQNFLHDSKLVESLIQQSNITKEDVVIEVGAGKGIITDKLSGIAKKVIAIELDNSLYSNLIKKYENTNVFLLNDDFLKYKLPTHSYKVFSNIPFNITANIITKLFESNNPPSHTYLIMQYEAFLKYAGKPFYNESYKSLLYKPLFTSAVEYNFKKTDFKPTPNADIVLASFIKKEQADIKPQDYKLWQDFLSFIFLEHGQTIKDKVKKFFSYKQLKVLFKQAKINDTDTVTTLSYHQWLILFELFNSYHVSKEKKQIVLGATRLMNKNQQKITKLHRNRRSGNWRNSVKSKTNKSK